MKSAPNSPATVTANLRRDAIRDALDGRTAERAVERTAERGRFGGTRCGCSGANAADTSRSAASAPALARSNNLAGPKEFGRRLPLARLPSGLPYAVKQRRQADGLAVMNHRCQNHSFQAQIGPIEQHDRDAGQRLIALPRRWAASPPAPIRTKQSSSPTANNVT